MKRLTIPSCKPALVGGIVACSLWLLPAPQASAELGTWAYPTTLSEKADRLKTLTKQLTELDAVREEQLAIKTHAEESLVALLGRLQAAEGALKTKQAPLHAAMEKYRQAQEIARVDPMIDTERQRLEYIRIENETARSIKADKQEINQLNQLISQTTAKLSDARAQTTAILRQIDTLWKHREIIKKIVFLPSVDD